MARHESYNFCGLSPTEREERLKILRGKWRALNPHDVHLAAILPLINGHRGAQSVVLKHEGGVMLATYPDGTTETYMQFRERVFANDPAPPLERTEPIKKPSARKIVPVQTKKKSEYSGNVRPTEKIPSLLSRALKQAKDPFSRELFLLYPRLSASARSLTHHKQDAEDLVHTTIAKALNACDQFEMGTNLFAWTCTIMKNEFLSGKRKEGSHKKYLEKDPPAGIIPPEQEVKLMLKEALASLEILPADQFAALKLVVLEERGYGEAALELGIPVGTIKSRVFRARNALKEHFGVELSIPD